MSAPRYDPQPHAPRPARILVVDDEPALVKLLSTYLLAEGFQVDTAESGAEALGRVEQGETDLVVLDLQLPDMSGFDVTRKLRANAANARLPVICLTGQYNDPDSEYQSLEGGADEYLHKPVERRALLARVKALLRLADAERDRRLLAQLAQSEKLAAIGQIAAGVAHEIHNPLAFMLANLASLQTYVEDLKRVIEAYRQSPQAGRQVEDRLDFRRSLDDLEALVAETTEGGRRVRDIVKELKSFSRAEAEDDEPEDLDLAEVVRSTLTLTERELAARSELSKEFSPAPVRGHRGKLSQVVLNLLVNALQAIEAKGPGQKISVRTGVEKDQAFLSVGDSGVGIPAEHQTRIFDPFFTTKPVGMGTGIGLSVCLTVVQRHGGTIELRSQVGQGTTFVVRLPARPSV